MDTTEAKIYLQEQDNPPQEVTMTRAVRIALITFPLLAALACQEAPRYSGEEGIILGPPAPLTWCAPQPVPYDQGVIPGLPAGFDPATFCDAPSGEALEPTHTVTFDPARRALEVDGEDRARGRTATTFRFAPDGSLREVSAEGASGFYGGGLGHTTWSLDEAGRLQEKIAVEIPWQEAPESAWTTLEKVQTWDGGRLLERVERDGGTGALLRRWTWTWDGAQLIQAALDDREAGLQAESRFTYHPGGLLASVERRLGGALVEREAWTFDAADELIGRTFWARPREAASLPRGLDSFQRSSDDFMEDPWRDAAAHPAGGCLNIPRGPGHGYPDAEPEHQLGVARDQRAVGVGFAYGNDSYGWFYGDLAWYGHDGLGSAWLGIGQGLGLEEVEGAITYQGGRMIQEEDRATLEDGQRLEVRRVRALDARGAILSDSLTVTQGDAPPLVRALRFERDAQGHLLRRALWEGDALLEEQRWARDAQGRPLEHHVAPSVGRPALPRFGEARSLFAGFSLGVPAEASWTWRYDDQGRVVERSASPNGLRQLLTWDAQGRLVAQDGLYSSQDPARSQRWTWDAQGRLTAHCTSWSEADTFCTTQTFDALGRLTRTEERRDEELLREEVTAYRCRE